MDSNSIKLCEEEILFESLINERIQQGNNTENIDKNIWSIYGKKRSILFTDLCGFSKSVHKYGIIHFIQMIYIFKKVFMNIVQRNNGQVIKSEGDSFIVLFKTVYDAINTAVEAQKYLLDFNKDKEELEKILLCVGIGYGDILKIGNRDLFGDEVNIASILGEDTAEAYEILVSEGARNSIEKVSNNLYFEELDNIIIQGIKAYRVIY